MTMTATARQMDGALRHEIDVNGRHVITTDEPERLGGGDAVPHRTSCSPRCWQHALSTMIALYAQHAETGTSRTSASMPHTMPT